MTNDDGCSTDGLTYLPYSTYSTGFAVGNGPSEDDEKVPCITDGLTVREEAGDVVGFSSLVSFFPYSSRRFHSLHPFHSLTL